MKDSVAIMTDTNSGVMADEAQKLGIFVQPMPFVVDGKECFEGVNLDAEQFYESQEAGADISSSQPSTSDLALRWHSLLEAYDSIVYVPMSSALSGSCETAQALVAGIDEFAGRVEVADCQRISVTQRQAVLDALRWVREGMPARVVRERLERVKLEASIYITVDTMEYLRKGGRVTPAAAAVGSILKIRPVLQIQGAKLDAFSVAKTLKGATRTMLKALSRDVEERFGGVHNVHLYVAHTRCAQRAAKVAEQMCEMFDTDDVFVDRLPLSIACHVGPGALGVGCAKIQAS